MSRTYIGARLRRLREELGLQQATLAERLGISATYLNQLEHDQRPLTAPVLLKLTETFGDRLVFLSEVEQMHLAGDLQEVALDLDGQLSAAAVSHLVSSQPDLAAVIVGLHRRYRDVVDQLETLIASSGADREAELPTAAMPYEIVRDFLHDHHNYFHALDAAAEHLTEVEDLVPGEMEHGLATYVAKQHGVRVELDHGSGGDGAYRSFDTEHSTITLSAGLTSAQRAYQIAAQIAFLEHSGLIDELTTTPSLPTPEAVALARIGLAHHFAAALLMPYGKFVAAAERQRYDIDALSIEFGVSFETACHRLTTLQRPGARGVPFLFVRVDQAGNISKRQSAIDFHFSRIGGSCPLWVPHDAFTSPGQLRVQLAEMPDGGRHVWLARTTEPRPARWGAPSKRFVVALGCDVRHADRLVYADGLDLDHAGSYTPIGAGCKVCDRPACPQRAFPQIGKPLVIDERRSGPEPYRHQE